MAQSGKAIDADLAELAAKHHGLIRASDLKTLGIERRVVRNRANLGIVTSLQPHVWLFGQTDATFEQQCRAAVWTSDGVLGGLSALVWHDVFRDSPPDLQPTIVVGRSSRPTVERAKLIRSDAFISGDRCIRDDLAVTSIPRSLVDSAVELTHMELERVLDDALLSNKTTIKAMKARVDEAHNRGIRDLRELVYERSETAVLTRSQAEQRAKQIVACFDGPKPQFQYPVRIKGRKFELDMAWPQFRVAIEIDGFRWHGGRSTWKRDLERDRLLTLEGWNIKRIVPEITPNELLALLSVLIPGVS